MTVAFERKPVKFHWFGDCLGEDTIPLNSLVKSFLRTVFVKSSSTLSRLSSTDPRFGTCRDTNEVHFPIAISMI